MQVPAAVTSVSPGTVLGALLAAGAPPQGARIIAAQSAFETAWWKSGLWRFNLGNLTTGASTNPSGDWQLYPGNSLRFRAYSSLQEGAADFVHYLGKIGALLYAENGDVDGYTQRICDSGYMGSTSTPIGQQSCDNLKAFMPGAVARLQAIQPVSPPSRTGGGMLALGAVLGLAVAVGYAWSK